MIRFIQYLQWIYLKPFQGFKSPESCEEKSNAAVVFFLLNSHDSFALKHNELIIAANKVAIIAHKWMYIFNVSVKKN